MERYDMSPLLTVALVMLAVVLLLVIVPTLMMPLMMGGVMGIGHHGYPWYGDGLGDSSGMWWGWPVMLLVLAFWLLLIGGVVVLVIWAVRRLATYPRGNQPLFAPPDGALEGLRQRYAKGEISREEYERIRQDLTG